MDTRQCRYIVEIAENKSISKAAERLFISQSGLNQQLMRIESELGATLFDRTTHSLKITESGKVALEYARDEIRREKNLKAQIGDILDGSVGEIRVNLAMEHGIEMFCSVFPVFHAAYPRVSLKLEDHIVYDQYDLLMRGKLDIGMVMISRREVSELRYVHLTNERFLLGLPAGHPLAMNYPGHTGDYPQLNLDLCREEPFSLMFQGSTMRQVIDPVFEKNGFYPNILFEARSNHVIARMVQSGICLTVFPESQAKLYPDICWFRFEENPMWEGCMIYHKDNPPTKAGWYFIQLANKYFS